MASVISGSVCPHLRLICAIRLESTQDVCSEALPTLGLFHLAGIETHADHRTIVVHVALVRLRLMRGGAQPHQSHHHRRHHHRHLH